jgi:AraC-like DNA-binding protein
MPLIVQLYILTSFIYIILVHPIKGILSDNFLKIVLGLVAYAGILRIALGLDLHLPFFFHSSIFLAYALFAPGAYLYIRNSVNKTKLKESDLIHFVPFFALCIYGLLAYFLGINIHTEVSRIWSFSSKASYDAEILMPLFLFIYCLTVFYFYQFLLLVRKTALKPEEPITQNHLIKKIMNDNHLEKTEVHHQPLIISRERMMEMDSIVKELLDDKKPYLQQRYSLKDLAIDTNIPLHHLSAFINKYCGKNFNDFINEFRVIYCKEKILNEEYKYKKLEAIAEESGFNNRNTFAIAFKKVMGLNPSEFLRKLKSPSYVAEEIYE